MTPKVPNRKVGTPFQRPSWRVDALRNPDKYGFRYFCSKKQDDAGHLKRLITKGISPTVSYSFPEYLETLSAGLAPHLKEQLRKIWNKRWNRQHRNRKIQFEAVANYPDFICWNPDKLKELNDPWFIKLVLHVFNIQSDASIDFALRMNQDAQYHQTKRFIGYGIFGGLTDEEIAAQWNIPPKHIQALRYLFYDFSYFPKDKVAQWALLKELGDNGEIRKEEFMLFKKIFEMDGYVAVKAFIVPHHLTPDEKTEVCSYLNDSAMGNTLAINYTTNTKNDVLVYNRVLQEAATLKLKGEELNLRRKEVRLLELQSQKIEKEIQQVQVTETINDDDTKLMRNAIKAMSRFDHETAIPSFAAMLESK